MATLISNRPALLAAQMRQMLYGLEQYSDSYTPTSPTKQELEEALHKLEEKLQAQINAAGRAEAATQELHRVRDESNYVARRMRDALYAHYGKHDARLVQFGLDTLRSKSSAASENETESEEGVTP